MEGLVEIREDYVEEDSFKTSAGYKKTNSTLKGNSRKAADEDEEYMRIQMRLDQLEKKKKKLKEPVGLMRMNRYKMSQIALPVRILLSKKLEVHRWKLQRC